MVRLKILAGKGILACAGGFFVGLDGARWDWRRLGKLPGGRLTLRIETGMLVLRRSPFQGGEEGAVVGEMEGEGVGVYAGFFEVDEFFGCLGDEEEVDAGVKVGGLPVVSPAQAVLIGEGQGADFCVRGGAAGEDGEGAVVAGHVEVAPEKEGDCGVLLEEGVEVGAHGAGFAGAEGGGVGNVGVFAG